MSDEHVLTPYFCPRDAAKAIDWYSEVLGARETGERSVGEDGRIGHASLDINGSPLMLSDGFPDYGVDAPAEGGETVTFTLYLHVPDVDATTALAQSRGATVQRPPTDQPYGARLAVLLDPFGVRWMFATPISQAQS